MKTTLVIDDGVMLRLKETAARRGCTMSELVEMALRRLLDEPNAQPPLPKLPRFDGGGASVDVADREARSLRIGSRHSRRSVVIG